MTPSFEPANSNLSAQNVWEKTLNALRQSGDSYVVSQLMQLSALSFDSGTLTLGVEDLFFRDWVDDHYGSLVAGTLQGVLGHPGTIRYEKIDRKNLSAAHHLASTGAVTQVRSPTRLNEKFTFENYVVADSNQLCAAAGQAVAEHPGRAYNPLFIYGGSGLGKTHLLHAIGNRILARRPGARVTYLSSEEFTNQFIESVRDHQMTEFRREFVEDQD